MKYHRGITVVMAGTCINLALGILYSWSVFKESIKSSIVAGGSGSFTWNLASINDPYALACLVFAFTMIPAGRAQDKFGPRVTAFTGGVLVSLGFLLIAHSVDYWVWVIGFGGLVGAGIAFGYSAATPAALKWFPPGQSGLIAGIVVSGFGLAPAYIAPLAAYLVSSHGLLQTMLYFGIAFFIALSVLATFLIAPPVDFKPAGMSDRRGNYDNSRKVREIFPHTDETPQTLLQKRQFWALWLLYFIGAGAGLMVIGNISGLAKLSMGEQAYLAVAILAIGNASGRVLTGMLSDKFGRRRVLAGVFLFQALLMFGAAYASQSSGALLVVLVATLIGFNYGANLAIFPSYAKDLWGMPHFGTHYGMLFTAWGMGGFVMIKFSEMLKAQSGSFTLSFLVAGGLLVIGVMLTFRLDDHKEAARAALWGKMKNRPQDSLRAVIPNIE
ncbi:MAG: OFA family MFS transporter [Nitrosomonadales bacterium]|nr:OFA family MFS transporter [Nitrosomonadales bacterium]